MLKKLIIFLIFFAFFSPPPIFAFEAFIKSENNPLSFSGDFSGWQDIDKMQSTVIFENGYYKMWYSSYNGDAKIIYATSTDGINWQKQKLLDLYPGYANHDPYILKVPGGYWLYFVASNFGRSNFNIYKIFSSDGVNFNQSTRQIVIQHDNDLERNGASSPTVLYKGGKYMLYYLCWGSRGFSICAASSPDGQYWQRCPKNPLMAGDGPEIYQRTGDYYLFYQMGGVFAAQLADATSCNVNVLNRQLILAPNQPYDSEAIISPAIFEKDNTLYLYYSGRGITNWTINLATSSLQFVKTPFVFLPGFFGSWNKEAIFHNQQVDSKDWRLNPIVKEYQGIKNTLNNLGYQENKDFFFFPYDWRKKITQTVETLNTFLINTVYPQITSSRINLVGHSLGGLIARIYGQKYPNEKIDKIIAIGSPHTGVSQVYPAVEGGEFEKNDNIQWLAQKMTLSLYKKNSQSDRDVLNQNLPVLTDLLPTYNFLIDQSGNEIAINQMKIQNELLLTYNQALNDILPYLRVILGEKGQTPYHLHVVPPNSFDALLNLYPDGRPVKTDYEVGDFVVLSRSAKISPLSTALPLDHGEIVYKFAAIDTLLDYLGIPHRSDQIIESNSTKVFPSLLFLILSPASIEVEAEGYSQSEDEGQIFIDSSSLDLSSPRQFTLKIKGKNPGGTYNLIIGQLTQEKDIWTKLTGFIDSNNPENDQQNYILNFNPQNPIDFPINQEDIGSLFDLMHTRLMIANQSLDQLRLKKCLALLDLAKEDYLAQKYHQQKARLLQTHQIIFQVISGISPQQADNLLDSLSQFENLYYKSLEKALISISDQSLSSSFKNYQKEISSLEADLIKKVHSKNAAYLANLQKQAQEKLSQVEELLNEGRFTQAEILLETIKELIKLIRQTVT